MTISSPITYQFSTFYSILVVHSSDRIEPSLSGLTFEAISRVLDSYPILLKQESVKYS